MQDDLTYVSFFSGIGGIDLGLDRAGWTCRAQVEIDPYCRRVLEKHWPDVPRFGDIKELTGHELPRTTLVAGGFPCQPVSLAGQRRGAADSRWLWPEFARLLGVLRPRLALLENVPGLLARPGMAEVLGDLAALGYDAECDCIPAAAFGAPHLRYRVFIVAYTRGARRREDARGPSGDEGGAWPLADADGERRQPGAYDRERAARVAPGNDDGEARPVANPEDADGWRTDGSNDARRGHPQARGRRVPGDWAEYWRVEPDVGRVAHGVPSRLDRLRCLGNAVVPQVAEWVGRQMIAAADNPPGSRDSHEHRT